MGDFSRCTSLALSTGAAAASLSTGRSCGFPAGSCTSRTSWERRSCFCSRSPITEKLAGASSQQVRTEQLPEGPWQWQRRLRPPVTACRGTWSVRAGEGLYCHLPERTGTGSALVPDRQRTSSCCCLPSAGDGSYRGDRKRGTVNDAGMTSLWSSVWSLVWSLVPGLWSGPWSLVSCQSMPVSSQRTLPLLSRAKPPGTSRLLTIAEGAVLILCTKS